VSTTWLSSTDRKEHASQEGKQGLERERERGRSMEYYAYQHSNSSGNLSSKEKRPPLKRGQLKRQIVRTISNLVVPRNAAAGGAASREKFSRGPSYN